MTAAAFALGRIPLLPDLAGAAAAVAAVAAVSSCSAVLGIADKGFGKQQVRLDRRSCCSVTKTLDGTRSCCSHSWEQSQAYLLSLLHRLQLAFRQCSCRYALIIL